MEEDEYRSTYKELADVRCVFEKALTNHRAKCALARHFCLADREGYSCQSVEASQKCSELLRTLRENSIFALKLREIDGPLPHNMEIRVQAGGLTGLVKLFDQVNTPPEDISRLLAQVQEKYGSLENLPYSEIIQSVVQFQGRQRKRR